MWGLDAVLQTFQNHPPLFSLVLWILLSKCHSDCNFPSPAYDVTWTKSLPNVTVGFSDTLQLAERAPRGSRAQPWRTAQHQTPTFRMSERLMGAQPGRATAAWSPNDEPLSHFVFCDWALSLKSQRIKFQFLSCYLVIKAFVLLILI